MVLSLHPPNEGRVSLNRGVNGEDQSAVLCVLDWKSPIVGRGLPKRFLTARTGNGEGFQHGYELTQETLDGIAHRHGPHGDH